MVKVSTQFRASCLIGLSTAVLLLGACKKSGSLASVADRSPQGTTRSGNGPLGPLGSVPEAPAAAAPGLIQSGADGPAAFAEFSFPPARSPVRTLRLWATFYYIPQIRANPNLDHVVRDMAESNILGSDRVSQAEWCDLALQGSGRIQTSPGGFKTVSFAGRSSSNTVNCLGPIQTASIAEKVKGNRFEVVSASFGRGARVAEVIPYRTIAVDPYVIPYGSVVYIPAARGQSVELASGRRVVHDGYFFAGDTGSAIHGSHIDVFTGTIKKTPFPFVTSHAGGTFDAWIIQDSNIESKLRTLHGFTGG